jgi:hypothetical protein
LLELAEMNTLTWRLLRALAITSFSLLTLPAEAATIRIHDEPHLPRLDAAGAVVAKRAAAQHPEGINWSDCMSNQSIRFPLALAGFEANAFLQAWVSPAGESCAEASSPFGTDQRCWVVEDQLPLQPEQNVDIPVRAIIADAPPFSPGRARPADDGEVCGFVDRMALAVHFLYFAPGSQADPSWVKTVNFDVDTVRPQRPFAPRVDLEVDPSTLRLSTDLSSADLGLRVYCNKRPPPDADVCPTLAYGIALADYVPDGELEASFACDDGVPVASSSVLVRSREDRRIEDGGPWVFNLASVDSFGNSSTLSDSTCSDLEKRDPLVSDGGCAISGRAASESPSVFLVVFGAATLLVAARRRRAQIEHPA